MRERQWLVLPRFVREFPADLASVLSLVVLTWVSAFVPVVRETPLRVVVGAAFVLFAPGYAIVAALFPESGESRSTETGGRPEDPLRFRFRDGIDATERLVAAVAMSVLVVPLVGLAVSYSPAAVDPPTLLTAINGVTIATLILAAVRRREVPPEKRFRVPTARWAETVRAGLRSPETNLDRALHLVVLLSLLVAAGSVAYAVAGPESDQSFTEFYLLHENETGHLVADDFPTTFASGQTKSLVVGVGNHENRPMNYSVVVQLQRVQGSNGTGRVVATQRLGRFRVRAGTNETVHRRYPVTPTMTGESLRLQYLLYAEEVPATPNASNAYRQTHVWVNVTA